MLFYRIDNQEFRRSLPALLVASDCPGRQRILLAAQPDSDHSFAIRSTRRFNALAPGPGEITHSGFIDSPKRAGNRPRGRLGGPSPGMGGGRLRRRAAIHPRTNGGKRTPLSTSTRARPAWVWGGSALLPARRGSRGPLARGQAGPDYPPGRAGLQAGDEWRATKAATSKTSLPGSLVMTCHRVPGGSRRLKRSKPWS
jgi:hypothetical protein